MSAHTPGPWRYHSEDLRGGRYWCVNADGVEDYIAEPHEDDNGEANARLIAAAPDLLAAAIELRLLVDNEGGIPIGVREPTDSAIAKATGATP